jgi:butyrate kinase
MNEQEKARSGRVLVINPGTTSTKIGVFTRDGEEMTRNIRHGDDELARFSGRPMLDRLEYRAELIEAALAEAGFSASGEVLSEGVSAPTLNAENAFRMGHPAGHDPAGEVQDEDDSAPSHSAKDTQWMGHGCWVAVAGRGGLLPPMECGTYLVDDAMVEELRQARRGEHACNLGAVLALRFARAAGVNAYIVDPVTADEWQPCARYSGSPLIPRSAIGHALNTKAVARRYARENGRRYDDLRLIVVHMGSGITVSAHRGGRMIDNNTIYEGPFGPDRTGSLPVKELAQICMSGTMTAEELDRHLFGDGGLFAYVGTRDLVEIEKRIDGGDEQAAAVLEAMIYQIGKEAGAMAAVLEGKVDAVLLTGGMAHSERVVGKLRKFVEWIAPVAVYPGEDELRALAEGVFRVLDGEEKAKRAGDEVTRVTSGRGEAGIGSRKAGTGNKGTREQGNEGTREQGNKERLRGRRVKRRIVARHGARK